MDLELQDLYLVDIYLSLNTKTLLGMNYFRELLSYPVHFVQGKGLLSKTKLEHPP